MSLIALMSFADQFSNWFAKLHEIILLLTFAIFLISAYICYIINRVSLLKQIRKIKENVTGLNEQISADQKEIAKKQKDLENSSLYLFLALQKLPEKEKMEVDTFIKIKENIESDDNLGSKDN